MSYLLQISDLSSIETVVGAWLAQCPALMEVFRLKRDAYVDFACKMSGFSYDQLWYDLKIGKDKERKIAAKRHRQIAKPGVLGAIYRLGGGDWGINKDGDRIKTGLWGYAENMGIEMTREISHEVVKMFRQAYPEIPQMWYHLEKMVAEVLDPEVTNVIRKIGPDGAVEMNRLNIEGRNPLFRMRLPSGRYLHYLDARLEDTQMPWKDSEGNAVFREALWYAGQDQVTHQWGVVTSHGGKLFENLVQGIARDVLATKLDLLEENDLPVVGHVHDEALCIVPDDPFSPTIEKMVEIMSSPIDWAPGLILGADGFSETFYHK